VAIASTQLPDSATAFHGATLSSFTSLTLHPHPLVAFSLRLPSRLAEILRPDAPKPPSIDDVTPTLTPDPLAPAPAAGKRINISLLSTTHESIAYHLSQPGADHSSLFSAAPFSLDSTSGSSGLPVLGDAIGNLTCEVVSSISLRDVGAPSGEDGIIDFDDEVEGGGLKPLHPDQRSVVGGLVEPEPQQTEASAEGDGVVHGSELFICRVLGVQAGSGAGSPLLYWKQQYTSAKST
jgi:flavin reductase (DIM6/NTAB) family NADH-FMN oxidoreductase RutF